MTAFADSSALVKLYADEVGSELVRSWPGAMFVSSLAEVEVASAAWRKHRAGDLTASEATTVTRAADVDLGELTGDVPLLRVVVTPSIVSDATELVARHSLRAYDAVQLATALTVREVAPVGEFLAFDRTLCSAAAAEGFDVPFEELIPT